ncbi:hypothetical protein SAMN04487970_10275 [Paenibacillus tianmuensis]|uniref:Uncharacterized protein n=1 Tax=Paenibacillus tianmuensis TaxID=624147 RepID=A0A1G4SEJ7_9BACL|nr:hypothetical protein SAMN04487970_10275 [Paenibacillus tianmuensis]
MNNILKYLIFFIANFVLTYYYIFPEPSYASSLLYSFLMTLFIAVLDAIKKKPPL